MIMHYRCIDHKRRKIDIEINDDHGNIIAYHQGKKVSNFDYYKTEGIKEWDEPTYELWGMNVDTKYQKNGIGTENIKSGEACFKYVTYPHDTGSHGGNHLSSEGKALIDSCLRKGIIDSKNYYNDDSDL